MKIQQIMSKSVSACSSEDSLNRAAQIMWEADVGSVPVVDQDQRLVGIITDRDVCMAAYTKGARLSLLPVSETMSTPVITCRPSETVSTAEQRMREHQIRRLPVVSEGGRLEGILSVNDLALGWRSSRSKADGIPAEDIVTTLADVCEHRPLRAAAAE